MAVSHKYRTFDQLLEDVTVDFRTYALEGMIEPQQLIKVATRVNYDLGLRIHRTKETVVDIELVVDIVPATLGVFIRKFHHQLLALVIKTNPFQHYILIYYY